MCNNTIGSFIDPRDKKVYKTVRIGTQTWLAENLKYKTSGSRCYKDNSDNCSKYGRLYDWDTAMKVAPPGWHLPTQDEWEVLLNVAGGFLIRGTHLKATSGWKPYKGQPCNGIDKYDFAALPGGLCNSAGTFRNAGSSGCWWSADTNNIISDNAYYQYMNSTSNVYPNSSSKDHLYSVRCVMN